MKVCSVEFSVDSGIVVVGSEGQPAGSEPPLGQLPTATDTQVFLSCRQQIAPIRMEIWRGEAPEESYRLFSGEVLLETGYIAIGETFVRPFMYWPICAPGERVELCVWSDGEGESSHFVVVVNPESSCIGMSRSRDSILHSFAESDDIGAVLAEHSFPAERVDVSIRIIRRRIQYGVPVGQIQYLVYSVIEWMRWLRSGISADDLEGMKEVVMDAANSSENPGHAADIVLSRLASALGMSTGDLLIARR